MSGTIFVPTENPMLETNFDAERTLIIEGLASHTVECIT